MMADLRIGRPDAQALLDYLQLRPYREVHQLVAILLQLQSVEAAGPRRVGAVEGTEHSTEREVPAAEAAENGGA